MPWQTYLYMARERAQQQTVFGRRAAVRVRAAVGTRLSAKTRYSQNMGENRGSEY
jgi:hypothetical protein